MLLEDILTKEEIQEFKNLKPKFNRVRDDRAPLVVASKRVDISYKTGNKVLLISAIINILTTICIISACLVFAFKPNPEYYAATPSGNLYGPLQKLNIK